MSTNKLNSILVFCGSSVGTHPSFSKAATELGQSIAERKSTLIYGGAKIGLMGALANAVLSGNAEVIGIIPKFLQTKEVVHNDLTELIVVQNMHQRKRKMFEMCNGIVALPGGFGTMEELFEVLTWAQLGLHEKPIGVLNINGFYDGLLTQIQNMVDNGFLKQVNADMVLVSDNISKLFALMEKYKAKTEAKWLDDGTTPF